MDAPLQRGSVVLRGKSYGTVWDVRGGELVLHPISLPGRARSCDVLLEFGELIAANIAMPEAVIRVGQPMLVAAEGQAPVGVLPGAVCCRVTLAAIRAMRDAHVDETWSAERRHRDAVRGNRPVRLV